MQTLVTVLSGIALLVWGTHIVRSGVLRVLGGSLRRVLASSVSNPFTAFLAGLGVTGLVQSSSATALLTGSFVQQKLMALAPALAIMLGADVGTSLVVQLFSLNLSWLSPLLIGFGVLFHLSRKATRAGQIGRIAIGLGLIILALQIILQAAGPLTAAAGVKVIFGSLSGDPLLDMLIGAVFTLMAWSSLAVVLLTAAFVGSGLIPLQVGLFLVIGANLGSGIVAVVATAGTGTAGRRVALGNLLFKLIGCVLAVALMPWIEAGLVGARSGSAAPGGQLPRRVQPAARRDADLVHGAGGAPRRAPAARRRRPRTRASRRATSTRRRSTRRRSPPPTRCARCCASATSSNPCSPG